MNLHVITVCVPISTRSRIFLITKNGNGLIWKRTRVNWKVSMIDPGYAEVQQDFKKKLDGLQEKWIDFIKLICP